MQSLAPLLQIDAELARDQVVYRTLDFFSAAAIVETQTLMFSRADTFADRNEGIERLLAQLEITMPKSGCGMGWYDDVTAKQEHDRVKRSHYISCWCLNPESVAMWSLYSPDFCSVRIATTVGRLVPAVDSLISRYSLGRLSELDLGKRVAVAVCGRIGKVSYRSLKAISERVTRKAKAQARIAARYARKGESLSTRLFLDRGYVLREERRRFTELRQTCNLKDDSLRHEEEIRLAVRLGDADCDYDVLDSRRYLDPSLESHILLRPTLELWGWVNSTSLP
jgi:hypothetical protein